MISSKKIEVTYSDTDMMGIVYHGSYIPWFELARTQMMADLGFKMSDFIDKNIMFPIANINITYKSPTKYLDEVIIETSVLKITKYSTLYQHKVLANNVVSVIAEVKIAHVDVESFALVNLANVYNEAYTKYSEVVK